MTTLTAANCQIYLRDIITSPSSIISYWNNICDNSTAGVPGYLVSNIFFDGNVFNLLAGNHATGSLVTTAIGSTDTMPTTNHTYAPGDTTFSNTWFLNHTDGATSDAVYTNSACTSTSDHSFWGPSYHTQLTAQITATASDHSVSFEAVCVGLDSVFREPGDATAGYCIGLIRQDDNGDSTYSCTPGDGSFLIAPYTTARVYLSALAPAPTGTFSAFPTTINNGESSTLTWTGSNVTSASIDHGVGSVTPASGGSVSVSPSVTTTYTLTLTGDGGSITKTATVTVGHPAPEAVFTATPDAIAVGGTSTLEWTIAHATSASINQGIGSVDPEHGTVDVSPSVTTTYTLSMSGLDGSGTQPVTVTVVPNPTGTFICDPDEIFDGQSTVLRWTSSNAATAEIEGIGTVTPTAAGHIEVFPEETTTYTLTLTNSVGVSIELEALVTVTVRPAYRLFFSEIRQTALRDWVDGSTDHVGMRFESFLETNQSLHDADLKTQVPYLYTFLTNGEEVDNPIGAFVSIVWDWRSHNDTLRVTPATQIYDFHNGYLVSVKKTRVRGKGRSLNLRYTSDADNDFNLKGWVIFYNVQAGQ